MNDIRIRFLSFIIFVIFIGCNENSIINISEEEIDFFLTENDQQLSFKEALIKLKEQIPVSNKITEKEILKVISLDPVAPVVIPKFLENPKSDTDTAFNQKIIQRLNQIFKAVGNNNYDICTTAGVTPLKTKKGKAYFEVSEYNTMQPWEIDPKLKNNAKKILDNLQFLKKQFILNQDYSNTYRSGNNIYNIYQYIQFGLEDLYLDPEPVTKTMEYIHSFAVGNTSNTGAWISDKSGISLEESSKDLDKFLCNKMQNIPHREAEKYKYVEGYEKSPELKYQHHKDFDKGSGFREFHDGVIDAIGVSDLAIKSKHILLSVGYIEELKTETVSSFLWSSEVHNRHFFRIGRTMPIKAAVAREALGNGKYRILVYFKHEDEFQNTIIRMPKPEVSERKNFFKNLNQALKKRKADLWQKRLEEYRKYRKE